MTVARSDRFGGRLHESLASVDKMLVAGGDRSSARRAVCCAFCTESGDDLPFSLLPSEERVSKASARAADSMLWCPEDWCLILRTSRN